jgi:hypothetical protein
MAGSFQGISPEIIELIRALAGGGSGITPLITGSGFGRFAQDIEQLSGAASGDKTQANIEQGLTGRSATPTPVAPAPRPSAPMMPQAMPSPTGNTGLSIIPLLAIGKTLSLLKSGVMPPTFSTITNPAIAPAGSTIPAIAVPGMTAGPPAPGAAAAPAAAATSGPPSPPVPFASCYSNQATPGSPLPSGIA